MKIGDTKPNARVLKYAPAAAQESGSACGAAPRQIVSVNTMPAVVGCVRAGLGFAIIPQIALHDAETASLDWFPFGAPPIHRRLGLVQRVTSRRAEVLAALVTALIQQGLSAEVYD